MPADEDVMADASRPEGGGLDRRSLIKRAAIVGGAAWTAPIIIDSLASPAAAATCTCDSGTITYTATGATKGGQAYSPAGGANTFTPCNGVTQVQVQAWGGGGG